MHIEQEERYVEGRGNGLIVAYKPKRANAKSMPRVGLPPTGDWAHCLHVWAMD